MTQFLPPNLLALFAAREPIPFKPPAVKLSWEKDRTRNPYTGIAELTTFFENPKETPPPTRGETKAEKKARRMKEKAILRAKEIEEEVKNYDPHNNRSATGDAFKTLFVARINFDTSESKLRREFDMYGPIRKIIMVKDSSGKPRGYAFIEFERERDMHTAYKNADGKKIDGRRVLVDVERGRTVKGWRPRRLGGGMGSTRRGANEETPRVAGRPDFPRNDRDADRRESRRSGSRERGRRASPPRERDRDRTRERRDRDRDRDRDRKRDRDRDRDRKDRDESGKTRDRERKSRRDRSKEREKDGSRRKRSRERDRKDRDRSDRDKDRQSRSDRDKVKEEPKDKGDNQNISANHEPTNGDNHTEAPEDQRDEYQESYKEKGLSEYKNETIEQYKQEDVGTQDLKEENMEY